MDFLQKYEMFRQEKIISLITSDRSLATQKKKKTFVNKCYCKIN